MLQKSVFKKYKYNSFIERVEIYYIYRARGLGVKELHKYIYYTVDSCEWILIGNL
jgi:hypothetical protein